MRVCVGAVAAHARAVTQQDFDRFAALTGDDNPIHVDPAFCATTRWGRTLAHGMMLYGILSGAIARAFPGALAVEQELKFPGPTFAGDELTVRLEVLEVDGAERLVRLGAAITTSRGGSREG